PADRLDRVSVRIGAEHVGTRSEKVDKVASRPTARIEHPHRRFQTPTKQLVEEVDVDLAELDVKIRHVAEFSRSRSRRYTARRAWHGDARYRRCETLVAGRCAARLRCHLGRT